MPQLSVFYVNKFWYLNVRQRVLSRPASSDALLSFWTHVFELGMQSLSCSVDKQGSSTC